MITIKNLNNFFNGQSLYSDISLNFSSTGLTIISGESGTGKTTLLKMIGGYYLNYQGEIYYKGKEWHSFSKSEREYEHFNNIGYIPQDYGLIEGLTVLENIKIQRKDTDSKNDDDLNMLFKELELEELENKKIEDISGGQKQRVALLRIVYQDPEIILVDEPTSSLDNQNTIKVITILKELSKNKKVIMITHDEQLLKYGDELLRLEEGKIVPVSSKYEDNSGGNYDKSTIPCSNLTNKISYLKKLAYVFLKKRVLLYLLLSLMIVLSSITIPSIFLIKLSSEHSISEYLAKNPQLKMIYLKADSDTLNDVYGKIAGNSMVDHIDKSYNSDITLKYNNKEIIKLKNKPPMDVTKINFVYGRLPKRNSREIALSTSIAQRMSSKIRNLVGKRINVFTEGKMSSMRISGIMNAPFDDVELSHLKTDKNVPTNRVTALVVMTRSIQELPRLIKIVEKNRKLEISSNKAQAAHFLKSNKKITNNLLLLSCILSIISLIGTILVSLFFIQKSLGSLNVYERLGFDSKTLNKLFFLQNLSTLYFCVIITLPVILVEFFFVKEKVPNFNFFTRLVPYEYALTVIFSIVLPQIFFCIKKTISKAFTQQTVQ
ncbi:ATP-binding cassette domain-containing protein [Enterococcus gilvus]|uniref:ATP-binding cassette domain-containing protein n=1 Tax=Enterococcus gilvus TaxID=160453 RepID=UPI003EDA0410